MSTRRIELGALVPKGGTFVELGVAKGKFAAALLAAHPHLHYLGIDKWDDRRHPEKEEAEARAALTAGDPMGARWQIIRASFEEALLHPAVAGRQFDLVYVDGYAHTGQDEGRTLDLWLPKVLPGGILAGHDYAPYAWPLTFVAVNEFAARHDLRLMVLPDAPYASWWCRVPWKHQRDYEIIHRQKPNYGYGPQEADLGALAAAVATLPRVRSCLDFGCGNSRAIFTLFPDAAIHVRHDFAHPSYQAEPPPGLRYDVGLCTDVMEHVPAEEIDRVLARLAALSDTWLFIIPIGPASQKLPDGSNAHVSQHPADWWRARLAAGLDAEVEIRPAAHERRFLALTRRRKI